MFCGECGTDNPDINQFCKNCGKPLMKKQQQPAPVPASAAGTPAFPQHVPAAQGPASPKKPGTSKKWIIIGAIIAVVIIAGIFVLMQQGSPMKGVTAPAPTAKTSEVVHGTISTGAMAPAAQGSISATGGTITVNQPGSAINGLKFTAPAGAYPSGQQVAISSAPITSNTFGSNFNPVTPMIEIDAGKGYADEPVLVTIPVNIPDGQFAMAFYYDDANKKLEGIPTSSQDSKSITIATRHFSNILVSLISMSYLDGIKKVESGFKPGVDTWEFSNPGSFIAPGGYCAGDSVTMMWYYTEQRQKNNAPPLNGRYDNNGREKTPLIPMDNTLGVRFASVMQTESQYKKYWANPFSMISNVSDSNTFREFKYSMLLTGEPQYVRLVSSNGAHAIVCFEIYDNTLWVADPNYPGVERMITLKGDKLGPYSSGANSEDIKANGETVYSPIIYIAKSAMFSWPTLAAEYAKVQDGTIGNDKFPSYKIKISITNDDGTKKEILIDGGKNSELKRVDVEGKTIEIWTQNPAPGHYSYYPDGKLVTNPITLNEGSNIIGVEGVGRVDGTETWLGFDWIDIVYKPPTTKALKWQAPPAGAYTAYRYVLKNSTSEAGQECMNEYWSFYSENDPLCGKPEIMSSAPKCGKPSDRCTDYLTYSGGIHEIRNYIHVQEPTGMKVGKKYYTLMKFLGYQYDFHDNGSDLNIRSHFDEKGRTEECVPNTVHGLLAIDPKLPYKPESGKYACKPEGSNELYYINTI